MLASCSLGSYVKACAKSIYQDMEDLCETYWVLGGGFTHFCKWQQDEDSQQTETTETETSGDKRELTTPSKTQSLKKLRRSPPLSPQQEEV